MTLSVPAAPSGPTARGASPEAAPPPARRGGTSSRWLGACIAVLAAGFCAASSWTLYDLRAVTYAQAVSNETNLLNALSADIARNVEIYDLSLQGVVDGLARPGLSALSPEDQDLLLFDRAASAKDLGAILVLDRAGVVVRGSKPGTVGAKLGDREYFTAQRDDPGRGLFISAPFLRRVTGGDDVIAFSRAVRGADGTFAGVVVGTMRLAYLEKLFSRADLGPHGSISLLRLDGISLMRVPYDPAQIGISFARSVNFQRLLRADSGTFTGTATVDGVDRIYSFAHIGDLPLVMTVALAEGDVFAVWRTKASVIAVALAVLCATAVAAGLTLRRQLRQTARAEALLSRSEAQYRLFADHAQDVIERVDRSLRRTYVSPAVSSMLGYAPEDLLARSPEEIVHPADWPSVAVLICASQAQGINTEATYRLRHKAGHDVWVEGRYSLVAEDRGFIVVLRDISARKAAEQRLEALNAELARVARSDALTGLANRRAFDEVLEVEWRRAERDETALSLLLIDVDRFKAFNDRYGHQKGDACLQRVADAVRGTVRRPADLTARYGGEEVAVILPGTDEAGAARVAERVRAAVEELALAHEGNAACGSVVTVSLGCATMRPTPADRALEALVGVADAHLYEAKRLGRNRVGTALSPASLPPDEAERLDALASYEAAGAASPSESLDRIARLTAQLFDMPMAFVSLVGRSEAVIVGRHNVGVGRAPRDAAYCAHTILGDEPLVVPSTRDDPRFRDNPLTGAGIGFYAGATLVSPLGGHRLGALCIADDRPRPALDENGRRLLTGLAQMVIDDLERARTAADRRGPGPTASAAA